MVIFNDNLVKVAENYLRKGSKVYIEGALQTRKWTDQSGVEKFSTEVVLQKFRGELTMLDGRARRRRARRGRLRRLRQRRPRAGQRPEGKLLGRPGRRDPVLG